MEEKAKSEKEQKEMKLRDEIDFCLCKFETTVDSFLISQLGLVEDRRLVKFQIIWQVIIISPSN